MAGNAQPISKALKTIGKKLNLGGLSFKIYSAGNPAQNQAAITEDFVGGVDRRCLAFCFKNFKAKNQITCQQNFIRLVESNIEKIMDGLNPKKYQPEMFKDVLENLEEYIDNKLVTKLAAAEMLALSTKSNPLQPKNAFYYKIFDPTADNLKKMEAAGQRMLRG